MTISAPTAIPIDLSDYEALVARGLHLSEQQDKDLWALGALADAVETVYGEATMDDFASRIKQRAKRLYEARDVWRTFSPYGEFVEEHSALSFSHYREAKRKVKKLGIETVLDLLDKADQERLKVEAFMAILINETGKAAGRASDAPRLKRIVKNALCAIQQDSGYDDPEGRFKIMTLPPNLNLPDGEYYITIHQAIPPEPDGEVKL